MHSFETRILREDYAWLAENAAFIFDTLAQKRLLVTGAAGFLCSYFIDILTLHNRTNPGQSIQIIATDNFRASLPSRVKGWEDDPSIEIRKHDVLDPILDERFDYIIHGASIASPVFYRQFPIETIKANVYGTMNMLELARQSDCSSVMYLSSSEVYGDPDPKFIPTPESYHGYVSMTGPRACYDESKRMGETIAVNFFQQYGTPVKIVRPFNVYGPGQRLNDQRIVPDLLHSALSGQDIVLLSDGTPTRSFTYVRDFMQGFMHVFLQGEPAVPFNVGNDEELSIRDLAQSMVDVASERDKPINMTYRKSDEEAYLADNPNRRCPDLSLMKNSFGWRPTIMAKEGLGRAFDFYNETGTSDYLP